MEIGDKVGKLTVVEIYRVRRGYRARAVCECGTVVSDALSEFKRKRRGSCRSAICKGRTSKYGRNRRKTKDGYMARRIGGRDFLEHRIVVEQRIGRPLRHDEVVHHLNGEKTDNRIENLYVCSKSEHARTHKEVFRELLRLRRENELLRSMLKHEN